MTLLLLAALLLAFYLGRCYGTWRTKGAATYFVLNTLDAVQEEAFRSGHRAAMTGKDSALDQDEFLATELGDLYLEGQRRAGAEGQQ